MSERGSFTTEYIYCEDDYKVMYGVLNAGDKYLCCSPASWSNGNITFEMPIVAGKVGGSGLNCEWLTIVEAVTGVITKYEVRILVYCDGGSIFHISKAPNGEVIVHSLIPDESFSFYY